MTRKVGKTSVDREQRVRASKKRFDEKVREVADRARRDGYSSEVIVRHDPSIINPTGVKRGRWKRCHQCGERFVGVQGEAFCEPCEVKAEEAA